ncbi:MAG: YgfZ/GcvT domain-containing protein [Actinomycetota bacterium]
MRTANPQQVAYRGWVMGVEAFRSRAGIVDRSARGTLQFTGEQARWFLGQLFTNDIEHLEEGRGMDTLLLTPNGRITHVVRVVAAGRALFMDTDPGTAEPLRVFLEGRVFATRVEISDRSADFAIVSVLGPAADDLVQETLAARWEGEEPGAQSLGADLPSDEELASTHFGSAALVRLRRPIWGVDLWIRRDQAAEVVRALVEAGGATATTEEFAELCVIEGLPTFGVDFDSGFLPQEAALERAVHFNKGCYLGQEAVAMAQRGAVKRRLRHLLFEGEPAAGPLRIDGAQAGTVTSVAREGERGFGIAVVRTSVPVGAEVEVETEGGRVVRAAVGELPGTPEGPALPSARALRERIAGAATPPRHRRADHPRVPSPPGIDSGR